MALFTNGFHIPLGRVMTITTEYTIKSKVLFTTMIGSVIPISAMSGSTLQKLAKKHLPASIKNKMHIT